MAQDLRDLFKEDNAREFPMKPGHEKRFADRLDREMGRKRSRSFSYFMIAASVLVFIGIGVYTFLSVNREQPIETTVVDRSGTDKGSSDLSLGDLSPDLQKIEQYYVTNINMELAELEISRDNKDMVDGYMDRLSALNAEYQELNRELNTIGPNDQTISALITNLQLRLQLLRKLKNKLDTLKSTENDTETFNSI